MKELNMPNKLIAGLALIAGTGLVLFMLFLTGEQNLHVNQADASISMTEKPGRHEVPDMTVIAATSKVVAKKGNKKTGQKYTCPMHPHYIANEMGTCPICGMDLVPLGSADDVAAFANSSGKRKAIIVAAETIQNMGVRTAKVERNRFGRLIKAYGIVKENEKLQYEVSNRLDGWIEELGVRAVGDPVKKGALLYKIYSPELFVSQRDYLSTLKGKGRNKARQRATSLRLRLYGVQSKVIRQLARTGKALMQVPFYAQSSGVISKLDVSQGTYVKRGAMIAKIQDYSKVWLMVSIAEQDLGFLTKNSRAQVTFPTLKGRKTTATIDYIYPTVDAASRTGQVRLVINNKNGLLRPGTYADVVFHVGSRKRLAVPSESLLRSESERYVIMALGNGRFEPRSVKTGLVSGSITEVVSGLKKGENIVVSGQFLLDSESALRESFRKLQRLQTPLPLLDLDEKQMAMVDHLVDAALYIHEKLRKREDIDAKFIQPAHEIRNLMWADFQHTRLAAVLNGAQKAISKAQKSRSRSRLRSALNDLVKTLTPWMYEGRPDYYKSKGINLFEQKGGKRIGTQLWVQQGALPLNPYGAGKAKKLAWPDAGKTLITAKSQTNSQQATIAARGSNAQ